MIAASLAQESGPRRKSPSRLTSESARARSHPSNYCCDNGFQKATRPSRGLAHTDARAPTIAIRKPPRGQHDTSSPSLSLQDEKRIRDHFSRQRIRYGFMMIQCSSRRAPVLVLQLLRRGHRGIQLCSLSDTRRICISWTPCLQRDNSVSGQPA